jgi:MFS family permease
MRGPMRQRHQGRHVIGFVQIATGISSLGDGVVLAAFPLLAASLTDDPRLIVCVTVAARLPWLLVALPAGVLVDRTDRRRIIVGTEACRSIALLVFAVLLVTDNAALPALIATAFLIGAGETLILSAVHAVVPDIVPPDRLAKTNGSLFAIQTCTEDLLGPALGGILFTVAASLPFFVDGVSFASAAVVLGLALAGASGSPRVRVDSSFAADVKEGVRYFAGSPALRYLGALISTLSFCQAMVLGPLVLFALDGLGLSDTSYGLLLAIAAIGSVVGGAVAGRLDQRFGPRRLVPAAAMLTTVAYGVCGLATNMAVAAIGLAGEAVAVALANVASLTLRQRLIPSELLGRVGNVMRILILGTSPFGAIVGGVLVAQFGVRAPFAAAVALLLLAQAAITPRLLGALSNTVASAS